MPHIRLLELRCTYKWGGGPDKTILLSAERHDKARVEVTVAYIRGAQDQEFRIADKASARGVNMYEITECKRIDFEALKRLRDLVLQRNINLIHSHDYKSDFMAYLVRRWLWRRPIKLVSTAHAWVIIGARGELYRHLDLLLMRRFDQLIAVSHATKSEILAAHVPEAKIAVIHNAIDTDEWSRGRVAADFRKELGFDSIGPVIGYVGRIMPEKDLVTWIQTAAPEIAAAGPMGGASNESLLVIVDRSARESGLDKALAGSEPSGAGGLSVRLQKASFDQLIMWLARLGQQNGIRVDSASIDNAGSPGIVNAAIVLHMG